MESEEWRVESREWRVWEWTVEYGSPWRVERLGVESGESESGEQKFWEWRVESLRGESRDSGRGEWRAWEKEENEEWRVWKLKVDHGSPLRVESGEHAGASGSLPDTWVR